MSERLYEKIETTFRPVCMCFAYFRQISPRLPLCCSSSVSAVDDEPVLPSAVVSIPQLTQPRDGEPYRARDRGSLTEVLSYRGRRETYVLPKVGEEEDEVRDDWLLIPLIVRWIGSCPNLTGMPVPPASSLISVVHAAKKTYPIIHIHINISISLVGENVRSLVCFPDVPRNQIRVWSLFQTNVPKYLLPFATSFLLLC